MPEDKYLADPEDQEYIAEPEAVNYIPKPQTIEEQELAEKIQGAEAELYGQRVQSEVERVNRVDRIAAELKGNYSGGIQGYLHQIAVDRHNRTIARMRDQLQLQVENNNAEAAFALSQSISSSIPDSGEKALAQSYVESQTDKLPEEITEERYAQVVRTETDKGQATLILNQKLAEVENSLWDEVGLLGKANVLAQEIFPITNLMIRNVIVNNVEEMLGTDIPEVSKEKAVTSLMMAMVLAEPEEQNAMIRQIAEWKLGAYGALESKSLTAKLFSDLRTLTATDDAIDLLFVAADMTIVADITRALLFAKKAGKSRVQKKRLGKEQEVGEEIATRLQTKTDTTASSVEKDMASATSGGKNPWDLDPEQLAGTSPHVQEQLTRALRELYEATEATSLSTGITKADLKANLDALRTQYDPAVNQAIHSVVFGEASETGTELSIFWQGSDGKLFRTRNEAVQYAQRNGMQDYEIIEPGYKAKLISTATDEEVLDGGGFIISGQMLDQAAEVMDDVFDKLRIERGGFAQSTAVRVPTGDAKSQAKIEGWSRELRELLGMEGRVFVADVEWMVKQAGFRDMIETVGGRESRSFGGFYLPLQGRGGRTHVIALNTNLGDDTTILNSLAHEFGHAIDEELLSANKKWRDATLKEFQQFIAGIDEKRGQELAEFIAKRGFFGDTKKIKELESMGAFTPGKQNIAELLGGHAGWQKAFHEWKADQIARFLFTDARPKTLAEKYFKGYADFLKEIATWIASRVGISRGEVTNPARSIRGFLAEHLQLVRTGQPIERDFMFWNPDLLFNRIPVPGKPNIKLKAKQLDETVKEEASSEGGYLVREKRFDPVAYDNLAKFEEEDILSANETIAVDPRSGVSEAVIADRLIAAYTTDKLKNDIQKFINTVSKGTTAQGREKVEGILRAGNEYKHVNGRMVGHEFSAGELRGLGLNDPEIQLYMGVRQLRMFMYQKRNAEAVRHLQAGGWKKLIFKNLGEDKDKFIGKRVDNFDEFPTLGTQVYDSRYKVVEATVEELYDEILQGKAIVYKLRRPHEFTKGSGEYFDFVIGSPENAQVRSINTVIPYRPGEYARIYSDEYFIDEVGTMMLNGERIGSSRLATIRTARTAKEARSFVTSVNAAIDYTRLAGDDFSSTDLSNILGEHMQVSRFLNEYKKRGWNDPDKKLDFHYDRSIEQYLSSSIDEATDMGRTFSSPRGDRIFAADDFARENTLDPWASIQAEATNTARLMTSSQWRETVIRKWVKTHGHTIPRNLVVQDDPVATFFNLADHKWDVRSKESLFAERTHRYILRQIGVRNSEERLYESFTRHLTEKFFTGVGPLEVLGQKIRKMDAFGFARNINFNLSLGFWNLAQIMVQGNGAVTAIAVSPAHGLHAMRTFPLLRVALMSDNPDVWRKMATIEKASTLGLTNPDEFVKIVEAVNKTGILSNLSSTAYWTREGGKLDMFAGYPKKAWRTNTAFFNRGEEFSRLVSFDVARREWIKKNPGLDWTSDAALKDITVRMDDLTLNMTKANMARWQQGAISIPAQFLQYNIKLANKFMTSMMKGKKGRAFTRPEAIRLLSAHLVMYGAAGNGLTWLVDAVMPQEMKDSLTTEQKAYINQGMISGMIASITGALNDGDESHIAVGSRLGAGEWFYRMGKAVYNGDIDFYEVMLGPSYGAAERIASASQIAQLWWKDPDLTGEDVLEGTYMIGQEVIGSLRNATRAWIYYNHEQKFLNRYGVPLAELDRLEAFAKALGFQPTQIVDTFKMSDNRREHEETMKEVGELIFKYHKEYIRYLSEGDYENAEQALQKVQALYPENAGERYRVRNYITKNLFPFDTKFQQLLADHFWRADKYDRGLLTTEEPRVVIEEEDGE